MAWTAPRTWVVGELVTAAIMNTHIRDNQTYLLGKHMFFPCVSAWTDSVLSPTKSGGGDLNAIGDYGMIPFRIPDDFASLTEAKGLVRAEKTDAAANWDIGVYYASVGEVFNTHIATDVATTYNVTATFIFEIDFATIMAGCVAGDVGQAEVILSTADDDCKVIGLYIEYISGN